VASLRFPLYLALVFGLVGCSRRESTPKTPASPATADAAGSRQTPTGPAETPFLSQPLEGTVNEFMTAQLRIFIQEKGRMPADFGELARTRLDSAPRTAQGTYWAIDPATQEVKLVKRK
jgi:hypothetical protein